MGARQRHAGEDQTRRVSVLEARARHAARASRLQTITAALSRAVTREEVARTLVERAMAALGADEGGLWTADPGGGEAVLVHGAGFAPDLATRWARVPFDAVSA